MSIIDYPKMEELFGSLDYCTCEHCKSALSPAAYLVELLQFIDRSGDKNPINKLLEKRPDIEHIQLTCENTNTVLPYIDLVNEILEYYVVNNNLDKFTGYDVGDTSSAELLANPQHVKTEAYDILKTQIYPFDLPFNQPLDALRLCYDYSKAKLHEVMEKLRVNNKLDIPHVINDYKATHTANLVGKINLTKFKFSNLTPGESVNSVALKVFFAAGKIKVKVYADDAGAPGALLGASGLLPVVDTGIQTFALASPVSIPANDTVWAGFECDNANLDLYNTTDRPDGTGYSVEHDIGTADPNPFSGAPQTTAFYTEIMTLPYAWREICNESLGISQEEYKVLTDSTTHNLPAYFGEDENMTIGELNDRLSYAKIFSRKTDITYNELIEIIKTQFINPNSFLIQKLENLTVSFSDIKDFHASPQSTSDIEEFKKKIPSNLWNSPIYGNGGVLQWINDNYNNIMNLILLNINLRTTTDCEFDKLELRYSSPDVTTNRLKKIDYWRFLRFIRLWKKLGWTIEETDKIITALYKPGTPADDILNLDTGFKDLIIKIAHVKKIMEKLNLPKKSLLNLLTVWSNIDTHGDNSLYKKMFLTSMTDTVYYENGSGKYLQDATIKITDHLSSIQAAFNVTGNELSLILKDAYLNNISSDQQDAFLHNLPLSLENVSKIYRYVFLSKALKLTIEEFVALKAMSGINPFNKLEYVNPSIELEYMNPSILAFIELAQLVKQSGLKISTLDYFLRHEDTTGKLMPRNEDVLSLAKTFKDGLDKIEQEYTTDNDVTGEIFKSRMALIYENSVVDKFFGLLKDTTSYSEDYSQTEEKLRQEIIDLSDKISYDHFQKRLTYQGVMTKIMKDKFRDISGVSDFKNAIDKLYAKAQSDFQAFFEKYPELKKLYDNYDTDLTYINDYKATHTHTLVGKINLTKFQNLKPGHLKSVNLKVFAAAGKVKVKVYADDAGAPGAPLGTSALLPVDDTGIQTFALASPVSIPANGTVWAGFECDNANLDLYNTTDRPDGTGYSVAHVIGAADPNPFSGASRTTAFYTGIVTVPSENEKLKTILENLLPALKNKLKHLFIKQTISSSLNIDPAILDELLEKQNSLHRIEDDEIRVYWNSISAGSATLPQNKVLTTYLTDAHGAPLRWLTTSQVTIDTAHKTITFTQNPAPAPPATAKTLVLTLDVANTQVTYTVDGTDHILYTDGTPGIGIYLGNGIYLGDVIPAIEDFLNLESGGVSAQYFFTNNATDIPDKEEIIYDGINFGNGRKILPSDPTPANQIRAVWQFYLEVPVNGNYNYYVETTGSTVKLFVDDIQISPNNAPVVWQNKYPIELNAGKLYSIKLEIDQVGDKAILKWENSGIGKDVIPVRYMYPYTSVENFTRLYVRLLKAINMLAKLALNEKEIAFFNTHFKIDGRGFLNAIPVEQNPNKHKVQALLEILTDLLRYVNLKKSLNVKDEALCTILNDPKIVDENNNMLLLKLTGWDKPSLDKMLERFRLVNHDGDPDLTKLGALNQFLKMYEAFLVVKNFGVSAKQLLSWTTNQPSASTVRDLTIALRAKYDDSVWLDALRQINDQLRSRQRDALVSYTLHLMQKNTTTASIDTPDKLFEYFLIDVENDPCTKTSRIKQAISTVQLFIQRCLLNLEPDISPESIKADQWEWMQRYRVWEANRKVFLYPENWLEPELRDNKSSFFKDLEGELVQADITNDLAENAFLNYLEKLDDVSKLEISGMYLEKDPEKKEDDILHVFGRTAGTGGKYYYRRFEYGHWTPWEKVGLDIEDNPILPVVWKGRLFLFWLNIVRKGSGGALPGDSAKSPAQLTVGELNSAGKESIEINLSWSEYYNNKWQPRKTSNFNNPIKFICDSDEFERKKIVIYSSFDNSGLLINVLYDTNYATIPLYVWHNSTTHDYFYTTDPNGEIAAQRGYTSQGIIGYIATKQLPGTVALYRFYKGDGFALHFYSTSLEEGKAAHYNEENTTGTPGGIVGYVAVQPLLGTIPIFRWNHPTNFSHLFTTDPDDRDAKAADYELEGSVYSLFPKETVKFGHHWFKLFNKHSVPILDSIDGPDPTFLLNRSFSNRQNKLRIEYSRPKTATEHEILEGPVLQNVQKNPNLHEILRYDAGGTNSFEDPFFYQDKKHVFFVQPKVSFFTIPVHAAFFLPPTEILPEKPKIPDDLFPPMIDLTYPRNPREPEGIPRQPIDTAPIDPNPVNFLGVNNSINKMISDDKSFTFGDVSIGPIGSRYSRPPNKNGLTNDFEMASMMENGNIG